MEESTAVDFDGIRVRSKTNPTKWPVGPNRAITGKTYICLTSIGASIKSRHYCIHFQSVGIIWSNISQVLHMTLHPELLENQTHEIIFCPIYPKICYKRKQHSDARMFQEK